MTDIVPYLQALRTYVEKASYAGYDPYDALNSPILRWASCGNKWVRVAFTQAVRRCPVNVRPLLGIRKGHNPKGLGLFLWGYCRLYDLERRQDLLAIIEFLLQRLEQVRSLGYSGHCWGYNFDWQSGTYFRPKGVPTIVNTAFIGHALLDCHRFTGSQAALDMAVSTKDFILNDLKRTPSGDTFCFSYTPVDQGIVHNANVLGASLLIRIARHLSDERLEDTAMSSLAYTMRHQREDGSWYYADRQTQRWVDSFHTGFVLQSLRYFLDEGSADQYRQAYDDGVRYYASNFFLDDGTPKYRSDRLYPIDIHSPAQAIVFFSRMGRSYEPLVGRVLGWMLQHMWDRRGYFWYRKLRFYTNKIPYMRWSQAWAFHALTEYQWQRTATDEDADGVKSRHDRDTRSSAQYARVLRSGD